MSDNKYTGMLENMDTKENLIVIERIMEVVNRAIQIDPEAIKNLLLHRVSCNAELATDPTIKVNNNDNQFTVSMLGILSGIAGCHDDGYSKISATLETICPDHGQVDKYINQVCPEAGCSKIVELGKLIRLGCTLGQ